MENMAPLEILMVEDDPADVELTEEALQDSKLLTRLHVVEDGIEAMEYLLMKGKYAHACRPDLIILDLNLPRKNGREVLQELKRDKSLKSIPVVVLSTSNAEEDILRSYNLGANCFITKPVGLEQFAKVVESIDSFWFTVVKLPPRPKEGDHTTRPEDD